MSSQTISVDDTGYSAQQLVDLLLSTSCATNSNISISSNQSVAYFNGNGSTFPISEGIIIRSGLASNTAGIYTGNGLDSQVTTNGDADLQAISDQSGQSATITDAAFLQFDFVPSSTSFSFDFLFASNEYGEWQCGFSDVFAFLLTDLNTGVTTNLAIIPGTTTPISVRDIRDNQYNLSCNSVNPELFSTYNVNDPANSALNMRGHTVVLNASSSVIPNNPYRIKLVIGDYNDSDFDSAVFIEAGSFNTALDIGPDQELCDGDDIFLDSGYTNTTDFSYEWRRNNVAIPGETNPSLTVTQSGTYDLIITTIATGCELTDQVIISDLSVNAPNDLLECDTGNTVTFNLTLNDHTVLGLDPNEYDIFYYDSLANANNNIPIDNGLISAFPAVGGETIYARIQNRNTSNFCSLILDFELSVAAIQATMPNDFIVCESDTTVDLPTQVEAQILNGLNPANYTILYFTSETDAQNNINPVANPSLFPLPGGTAPIDIWARLIDNTNPVCFDVTSFTINISPSPDVDDLDDVFVCTEYTLPTLTNGNYFTASGGTGTQLNAGDLITNQTTIFIYNENADGCFSETSFIVYMADEYNMETEYCGEFIVPSYPDAQFYTETGGPNGTGTVIPAGTIFNNDITIFFYAEPNGTFCVETQFDIQVHPLPIVEQRDDVITCDSYTLPPVINGEQYFTEAGGTGTELFPGDQITSSQLIYLWGIDAITLCTDQTSFNITIIDTSVYQDLDACGVYTVPTEALGGYFTQPMGGGTSIPAGTEITSSQTIYYYASEVTTAPNCTDNIEIEVTINPIPPVDELDDILRCQDDLPTLQPLVNGQYFTESGGLGTQLLPGDQISSSQTIYIYNTNAFCDAETSFNVEIRPFPLIDNFTDIFSCEPYTLPVLSNGQYYTETGGPNGIGVQMNAGDIISETQTLYIYNEYADLAGCSSENVFTINILGIEVDEPADAIACLTYELPPLTVGNYFTESGGLGTQLNAGDIITSTQTIYVYAENGDRFVCSDEHQFTVTIFEEPVLPPLPHLEACESITLPTLNIPGVTVEYYRRPNRVDLIAPSDYTITALGSRIIYVYAYQNGNPDCSTETFFQVTVFPLLDLEIQGGTICVDAETGETRNPLLLESGLDPNEFTVNWYLNGALVGTGPNYNAIEEGTYVVETTKLTADIGANCNYNPTEVVVNSSTPRFEINFLTGVFAQTSIVEILTIDPGLGYYEFSLDNGIFQEFNKFYNVAPGTHTITVRDLSGLCGDFVFEFMALDYPKFFTPNDDGINDTWNIYDLRNNSEATIKIFNRLGRLVSEIKTNGNGWNGYNNSGKKEPSSDYWFLVEFMHNGVPTKFEGHFSLLRK
ncbi:choice-of-anchor L domain-containing protein [Pseudotenacibaculum sp. MALMAid0570]|uniref:choice-of-anchor L domain-containing protein n=1 Tax=Pseudotenacibaculum sp. MALMAid0570 TaxID=3143938 RepID=UPI0032DEA484